VFDCCDPFLYFDVLQLVTNTTSGCVVCDFVCLITVDIVKWIPGLSRGKVRPGRAADHSPPSGAAVMEE